MRTILTTFACLVPMTAMALDLPVSGAYGTRTTCAIYSDGGSKEVVRGVDYINNRGDELDEAYLLVSPTEVLGAEWGCRGKSVSGRTAVLSCDGEGEEWESNASFRDGPNNTLIYTDEDASVLLRRCE